MTYKIINTVVICFFLLGGILIFNNVISFWLVFGFVIGYLLFLLIVSSNVQFNFFVTALNNNKYLEENKLALSFDDGPVENTLQILEVLEKYNVKAAFFCIGKNIEAHPEIFKKIIEDGHIIGNHTYTHTRKMGFLNTSSIIKEIEDCDRVALKIGGLNLRMFRPPFGIINPKTKRALNKTGHKVIGWNIRSYDAILNQEDFILNRIKKKIKPGAIILLHDNNLKTVVILEQLLLHLKNNNFEAVRLDKLFSINAYN